MSISALSGSSDFFSSVFNYGQSNNISSASNSDDIAASIVANDDADGNGLLSLSETPLDEDRFNSIDADGDGYISAEELSADAQTHLTAKNTFQGQMTMAMQGIDTSELVSSIFSNDDSDGDGLLSLSETPLDEDIFNSIDADGDGYISSDELTADMEANMAQGAPSAGTQTQAAAASSSESDSEEDYDVYDLNEDGQVSFDELLQAFNGGDSSLTSMFENMGFSESNMTRRLAMQAYQQQMA